MSKMSVNRWQDIDPYDATAITLPHDGIEGPLNEMNERCPWPWDPQQLAGEPLGMYHCPYCGGMVIAGMEHPDYEDPDRWWED
jgi:hypothetical protein